MIDWDLAISTGVRFARQGPQVSLADARAVVAELRGLTAVVQQPVRDVTGLTSQGSVGPVAVVDRPGWIRANVGGFRVVLEPLAEKLSERSNVVPAAGSVVGVVGSRVTGVQAGLILAYLSSRVLGQYELFLPPGEGGAAGGNGSSSNGAGTGAPGVGRLTLVAPNIVMVERELGVEPHDFRRWVCLHEETHRVQFTSVPWLRELRAERCPSSCSALRPRPGRDRSSGCGPRRARWPGRWRGGDGESLVEAMQTPAQRELLDKLTAVMTLVEGHGDYVMDARRPAGRALGGRHQGEVQLMARLGGPDGADPAPHPRHRPQDEAVRGGRAVRPHRGGEKWG